MIKHAVWLFMLFHALWPQNIVHLNFAKVCHPRNWIHMKTRKFALHEIKSAQKINTIKVAKNENHGNCDLIWMSGLELMEAMSSESIINCSCLFYNSGESGTRYIEKQSLCPILW